MKRKTEGGFSLVELLLSVIIILVIFFIIAKIAGLFNDNDETVNDNNIIQSEEIENENESELLEENNDVQENNMET